LKNYNFVERNEENEIMMGLIC